MRWLLMTAGLLAAFLVAGSPANAQCANGRCYAPGFGPPPVMWVGDATPWPAPQVIVISEPAPWHGGGSNSGNGGVGSADPSGLNPSSVSDHSPGSYPAPQPDPRFQPCEQPRHCRQVTMFRPAYCPPPCGPPSFGPPSCEQRYKRTIGLGVSLNWHSSRRWN